MKICFKKMLKQSLRLTIIFRSLYKENKNNVEDTQATYNIFSQNSNCLYLLSKTSSVLGSEKISVTFQCAKSYPCEL